MSGLISSLGASASSLQAHSKAVEQAGKNLANINNPDYARQRVVYGNVGVVDSGLGPQSGPLAAMGVEQVRDAFLDSQLLREMTFSAGLDTEAKHLQRLLADLGDSVDRLDDPQFIDDIGKAGGSVRGAIDGFFNAFEAWSARPADSSVKQEAWQAAERLVSTLQSAGGKVAGLQTAIDAEVADQTETFNAELAALDRINREIARLEAGRPGAAVDLRDQRQAKLENLSEYAWLDVEDAPGGNGMISVGVRRPDGGTVQLVGPGAGPVTVAFDAENRSFSIQGTNTEIDLRAGKLDAAVKAGDGIVADFGNQLDSLAAEIVSGVNAAYAPTGENFFDPDGSTARTMALDTSLSYENLTATATGLSGGNEIALAIADLADTGFSALGGATPGEYATRMTTRLGIEVQNLESDRRVQRDITSFLKERRNEVSGVSMDEEVARMTQAQRAFQASSRVFNVLSEMLETIVTGLR